MKAPGPMGWMDYRADELARTDGKIEKDPMALLWPLGAILMLVMGLVIGMLIISLVTNDSQLTSEHVCSCSDGLTTVHMEEDFHLPPGKSPPSCTRPETVRTSSGGLLHTNTRISSAPPVCCKSPKCSGENGDLHTCSFPGEWWGCCARGAWGGRAVCGAYPRFTQDPGKKGPELHTELCDG